MIKFLLALLMLVPGIAFAVTQPGSTGVDLTPPPGDLSVSYLANIFGVVTGVLHGTGSQIVGTMFGVFNAVILTIATIILTYVLFVSTINTANEGEMLGKKWSSIWIPLRTVGGVALLVPNTTGYSVMQTVVMMVVLEGVAGADAVWSSALDYLQRGGTIIEPSQNTNNGQTHNPLKDNAWVIQAAGYILKSEVCMYSLYNALLQLHQSNPTNYPNVPPNFTSTLTVLSPSGSSTINYATDTSAQILFPGVFSDSYFSGYTGTCGSTSWQFIDNPNQINISNPAGVNAYDSESVAVRQMVIDLAPAATSMAASMVPPPNSSQQQGPPVFSNYNQTLVNASADYVAIIEPALVSQNDQDRKKYTQFIANARATGWINAGAYFADLSQLNSYTRNIGVYQNSSAVSPSYNPQFVGSGGTLTLLGSAFGVNVVNNVFNVYMPGGPTVNACTLQDPFSKYICAEYNSLNRPSQQNPVLPDVSGVSAFSSNLTARSIFNDFNSGFTTLETTLLNIQNTTADPIVTVSKIGFALVHWAEWTWITTAATLSLVYGTAVAAGFAPFIDAGAPMATAISGIISWLLPILGVGILACITTGGVLAYYTPMIPYILFLFGAIGWICAVFEAMLASPLVALGFTHPEGHDFLGKAEQAVMLLLGVFLRPMLMIFGFIAGIILANVGVWLLNQGISLAWQTDASIGRDPLGLVYLVAVFSIYTGIVLAIFNKSFALIYEIPDVILTWIGGPAQQRGGARELEAVKGEFSSGVQQAGQAIQKGGENAHQLTGGIAKGAGEYYQSKKTKGDVTLSSGGGDGGKGS